MAPLFLNFKFFILTAAERASTRKHVSAAAADAVWGTGAAATSHAAGGAGAAAASVAVEGVTGAAAANTSVTILSLSPVGAEAIDGSPPRPGDAAPPQLHTSARALQLVKKEAAHNNGSLAEVSAEDPAEDPDPEGKHKGHAPATVTQVAVEGDLVAPASTPNGQKHWGGDSALFPFAASAMDSTIAQQDRVVEVSYFLIQGAYANTQG